MKDNILVSIIVPVYNVEKYLDECIASILRQTHADIEVILIDDGSKDSSGIKADEWQKRDSRIVVVHKENGGLSSARNEGIKIAKGEYFFFVDSDDYIADNCIEVLLERAIEENADISSCKFYDAWVECNVVEERLPFEKTVITPQEYTERIYLYGIYTIVWNKLYRRRVFDGLYFAEGRLNEDAVIVPKLISAANKIAHSPEVLYYYRKRKGSIMIGKGRKNASVIALSLIRWLDEETAYYSQSGEEYLCKLAQKMCANKILEYYVFLDNKTRREGKKRLRELSKVVMGYKRFSSKSRLKIFVAACFPWIYSRYYNYRIADKAEYTAFE